MAPRSAKNKKTADVKVAENATARKGRKGKQAVEPETEEMDLDEKTSESDKKVKRGKKILNDEEQNNGTNEVVEPPAKKSKRKNAEEVPSEDQSNDGNSTADDETTSTPADEIDKADEETETNGHIEESQVTSNAKGRKKPTKKELATEKLSETDKPKETGRGRKNAKQSSQDSDGSKEEKTKPSGRGRGKRAQAKPSNDSETEDVMEEVKNDPPATKGRKKPARVNKEKSPEPVDKDLSDEKEDEEIVEEETQKKEVKSRKNQGRKAQPKAEIEEKDDDIKEESQSTKKRRGAKKDEKNKGDAKDDDEAEEKAPDAKPTRGKKGQKKAAVKSTETDDEIQDTGESTNKRRRKQVEDKATTEDAKKKPPKNKASTDYEGIDFSNKSKTEAGKEWNFKISSWNVDGIRAWLDKAGLDYIKYEKPDILCLQEVKCSKEKLPDAVTNVPGYHAYWLCSEQDGYAGVGVYTTKLAMNVQYGLQDEELDNEGRIITAEYEQFYLVCTYVPNSGRKLVTMPKRLRWNEEFRKHVRNLDKKKPVIICGDMNVSHNPIDLANPKTNKKNAGFTDEERAGMTELLGDGFVDTYRQLYPEKSSAYTFWTYMFNCRAKNVGWRLDYFLMSQRLTSSLCDSVIRDEVYGSDHCPITLFLHLSSANKPKE